MKYIMSIPLILVGAIYIGEAIASWFGYKPSYSAFGSIGLGMCAVEVGILRLLKKED